MQHISASINMRANVGNFMLLYASFSVSPEIKHKTVENIEKKRSVSNI